MQIAYDQPRGTLHDLAALGALCADRCHILCVSERTLYLLANLASLDVAFRSRYAVELTEHGYSPVTPEHEYYPLYAEVVNRFQLEVLDMTCDIQAGLDAIAAAIESAGGAGGGCGGSYASPVLNCIVDLDNEHLLGPGDSTQGHPGADPPPDGFATWEEYFDYKCKAAAFIWDLERKHMVMLKNFEGFALIASIVGPAAAGLLGILPAAMTPPGFAVFVASVVAIGVVAAASWFYMDEMIDEWDTNKDAIICSLYSSGTSVEAVGALGNALEDAIQSITAWGALEAVSGQISELLGLAFGQLAGNGIVKPMFEAVVAVTQFEHDCSGCDEGEADLYLTGLISPYNRLLIGDAVTFYDESTTLGYQQRNSDLPDMAVEFIAPVGIGDWTISGECSAPDHPGETMHRVIHVDWWRDESWGTERTFGPHEFDSDVWTWFEYEVDDYPLTEGELYRVRYSVQEFNWYGWFRRLKGTSF